ncbi:putative transporter [Ilyonectria robusta]
MPPAARNPTNWDQYDGRPSPTGSLTSSALAEEQALLDDDDNDNGGELDAANRASGAFMSRRRSSVTNHLAAIADIGGVNSFRSFARSWQRAAGFPEVIPRRPSFVYVPDQDAENVQYGRSHVDNAASGPHTSLLRQHLEASSQDDEASASYGSSPILVRDSFRERESKPLLDPEMAAGALPTGSPSSRSSIFAVPPHLATPSIIGSYGSHYGTIDSTMRHRLSVGQAPAWIGEDEEDGEGAAHGEHQPILVKEVKEGDKVVLAVEGQSTLPQSVFNSINAIIGVGLLSLPLAFRMSGWIPGLFILTLTAAVTSHTGKLLAKCMDYDRTLITYSDLAYVSFGARARVVVSALFTLELISANVALVILFADSLDLLLPGFATVNIWKCTAAVLVLMLNAMPLRFLSYTSVIGIFSTFCTVIGVLMFGDGIREAITSNILKTSGYPDGLTVLMCVFIAIIPLTKIPLNSRPIITTLDVICGVHQDHHHHHGQPLDGASTMATQITRGFVRVFVVVLLLCISIVIPSFDSVCAFLGAALCTLISIILPISFHLKLFWKDISVRERLVSWVLLVVFGILAVGTVRKTCTLNTICFLSSTIVDDPTLNVTPFDRLPLHNILSSRLEPEYVHCRMCTPTYTSRSMLAYESGQRVRLVVDVHPKSRGDGCHDATDKS